jgi:hypothetical protein
VSAVLADVVDDKVSVIAGARAMGWYSTAIA